MDGLNLSTPQQGLSLAAPATEDSIDLWLHGIVNQHKDKNFVNRILNPGIFPNIDLGNGQVGTHLMAWGTMGKEKTPIVYPSIQQDPTTGQLKLLDDDAAFKQAVKSGEYIPFNNAQEADLFSREYKRLWNK